MWFARALIGLGYGGAAFELRPRGHAEHRERPQRSLKHKLCHGTYPVHEAYGIVFAYMGPPEKQPPFPVYDTYERPGGRTIPGRKCFIRATGRRSSKTRWIRRTPRSCTRSSAARYSPKSSVLPELDFIETPIGMIYVATRRVGEDLWARMVETVLPNLAQVAPICEDGHRQCAFSGPMTRRWAVLPRRALNAVASAGRRRDGCFADAPSRMPLGL
jgi:hypothetical protein